MYRRSKGELQVFLAHPGRPFWAKKDKGAWTIPKGKYEEDEDPLATAQREFQEETGFVARGPYLELGSIKQPSGKDVTAWGFEGNCDPSKLVSNTCQIEWPPGSNRLLEIPEIDRGAWFSLPNAAEYIVKSQRRFLKLLHVSIM